MLIFTLLVRSEASRARYLRVRCALHCTAVNYTGKRAQLGLVNIYLSLLAKYLENNFRGFVRVMNPKLEYVFGTIQLNFL